jgi:uncharacterized protein YhaN
MLHGQNRRTFKLSSSLDHAGLREGGRAILDAKDDIGEALFAAGSGLTRVHAALKSLEAEAEAVWKKGASSRTYARADREHREAKARLQAALLKPKVWSDAQAQLATLTDELERLEKLRLDLTQQHRSAQRLLSVGSPVRRRGELLAALDALGPVSMPPDVETGCDAALLAAAEAERRRDAADVLLREVRERLSTVVVDDAALARATDIASLPDARGAAIKGLDDLTRRRADLVQRTREHAELVAELGLSSGERSSYPPGWRSPASRRWCARTSTGRPRSRPWPTVGPRPCARRPPSAPSSPRRWSRTG